MKYENSLFTIHPYKYNGIWVFDDEATGLFREAFVAGINLMIDKLVDGIINSEVGFNLIFSAGPFPGYDVSIEWRRKGDSGYGNWYWCDEYQMEGWLCPALFKYFDEPPKKIYVKAVKSS